jgi:acylphosphatase
MKPLKLNIQFFASDTRIGVEFDVNMAAAKKALQILNNEVKKSEYAWKAYAAETEDWEQTADGLRKKVDALTDKQEKQKKIVENLSQQYKASEERYGENHKLTSRLAKDYEAAKYELAKTTTELKDYTNKLDDANNETDDLGDATDSLEGKFTVLKGTLSNLIADGLKKLADVAIETAKEMINAGISFESSFAGVRKTVDATDEEFAKLKDDILEMSTEVASSADDIASVMEMAGQLGIHNDALTDFTKTMIMLGDSTNMDAGEAAETLARFANITGMSQKDFEKLGSTLVDLGNNYATTEGEIMTMALRLAGAGTQVGLAETDILGLATALSSVGIEAEMGGTALSKAMTKMENATSLSGTKLKKVLDDAGISLHDLTLLQKNNKLDFNKLANSLDMTSTELANLANAGNDLEHFAEISGMTAEEFTKAWEEDASGALIKFIKGLGDTSDASENAITMLSEMGITEVRLRDSLVRASNASDLFNGALKDSAAAWEENTALVTEAERRYETVESQMQMAKNELIKVGIAIYDKFRGPLVKALDSGRDSIKKFGKQLQGKEMTEAIEIIADGIGKFVKSLIELATKVIPKVLTGMAKLIKNWDKIKPLVVGATTALIAYKVANSKLIVGMTTGNALMKVASTVWGVLTGKIKLATVAQKLFNVAQAATPWGLIAIGIGAVVAATVALADAKKKVSEETQRELDEIEKEAEAIEKVTEARNEEAEAIRERDKAADDAISEGLSEIGYYEELWEELKTIADENGKIKDGYQARADFIIGQLNDALGLEIERNGDVIKSYQEVEKSIDSLIEKKKAQIILDAKEEGYSEAIKNIDNTAKNYASDKTTYDNALEQLTTYEQDQLAKKKKLDAAKKAYENGSATVSTGELRKLRNAYGAALEEYEEAEKIAMDYRNTVFGPALENYKKSEKLYKKYATDKAVYENMSEMFTAGDYQGISDAFSGKIKDVNTAAGSELLTALKTVNGEIKNYEELIIDATAKGKTAEVESFKKELEKQNKELLKVVGGLKAQIPAKLEDMTPDMKKAWIELATTSKDVYIETIDSLPESQRYIISEITGVVGTEGILLKDAWATLAADSLSKFTGKNVEFKNAGNGMVQLAIEGINVGSPMATKTMETLAGDLVEKIEDGKVDAKDAGEMLLAGIQAGISNQEKQGTILGKIGTFANSIVTKLKTAWDEHSPSKKSQKLAEYFMEGIGLGITKNEKPILDEMGTFANEMASTLQSSLSAIRTNVNGTVSLGANTDTINEIGQIQPAGGKTVIINQTNNSPKSLDRLEIWRQTHNAATLAARN